MKALVVAAIVCAARIASAEVAAGTVSGSVVFDGKAPERAEIERDSDPVCAQTKALAEDVIVTGGKLRDVLVRVKKGTRAATAAAATGMTPLVITQHDCRYAPHVSALLVGQPLAIKNGDATYHNVHVSKAGKNLWNLSQPAGDPDIVKDSPGAAGDVISFHCDVHAWMQAWAIVVDNPYFAVSGDDGAFTIAGLAPGSYTLEAWHPVLGTRTATITIGKGKRARATTTFHFKPVAAAVD